ncbi:hypothetical protein [Sphaerobacter thermophilus]|uniref:RND efflux transporter n=1 Tax=Sphaerobacter thermophilus (strain ATCC 49802 / DSM 20745 / KCCM 41009 / NCIMB 13125 / S 6022) TaxID=479434 RepID=D1C917_SPHTD|nr:hypothetical protein [Sphaerobacter thermophilus]ACZ40310.1 RND efflux transporter [Sphaerobacter thermophilus DSM 20745]
MQRGRYRIASAAAVLLGIALILLSELGGVHEVRVFGAGLISLGGIGLGILAGLDQPRRVEWLSWLRDRRVALGMIAALVSVAPVVVAFASALVALPAAMGEGRAGMALLGGLIALLMLIASVGCFVLAVRAIRRAARPVMPGSPAEAGEEAA